MPKWIIAYVSVGLTLLVQGGEDQKVFLYLHADNGSFLKHPALFE
jgi:hypothetical protein